jgi:hypothetical protein
MNKYVKVAVIAGLVGLAVLAVAAPAFAQGGTPPTARTPYGPGRGGMMGGGYGFMAQYQDQMHTALAKALGLSVDDFNAALAAGQTPWQIAQEQGIDAAKLQSAMTEAHAAALKQAVKDGVLTQAQADLMLARQAQMQTWHAAGNYGPGQMGGRGFRAGGAGIGPCAGYTATATP